MKLARHSAILKLIKENDIETQSDLVEKLNEIGYPATQATVSRDIRALKLTKAPLDNGKVHYVAPTNVQPQKYIRVFQDSVVSIRTAQNILVVKTVSGMAMAAAASLDEWGHDKVIGCIAGDDTIFCALESVDDAISVKEELEVLLLNE